MNIRILHFYRIMIPILLICASCGNNPKPAESQETEKQGDTLTIPEPSNDTGEIAVPEDTSRIQPVVEKKKMPEGPPPNYSSLPGPVGFVNEDNLILREKPAAKSNKITTLKLKETVYILETTMVGEDGALTQYPTWYRVERKNKERGWVKASAVSSGH